MTRIILTCSLILVLFTSSAFAQKRKDSTVSQQDSIYDQLSPNSSGVKPTPEMWFYLQEMDRHDNPKLKTRRKAEFRAAQRRYRIAAMKWHGLSNARPTVSVKPWNSYYSAAWAGSYSNRFQWVGSHYQPRVVLHIDSAGSRFR